MLNTFYIYTYHRECSICIYIHIYTHCIHCGYTYRHNVYTVHGSMPVFFFVASQPFPSDVFFNTEPLEGCTLPWKANILEPWKLTSWWFQSLWNILVKNGHLPQIGMKIKNISNHHPVNGWFRYALPIEIVPFYGETIWTLKVKVWKLWGCIIAGHLPRPLSKLLGFLWDSFSISRIFLNQTNACWCLLLVVFWKEITWECTLKSKPTHLPPTIGWQKFCVTCFFHISSM